MCIFRDVFIRIRKGPLDGAKLIRMVGGRAGRRELLRCCLRFKILIWNIREDTVY